MNLNTSIPKNIFSGYWRSGHCQGIVVDTARQYIYYSFTTELVKTDMQGNLIGTAKGLLGHLGCIAFNDADGKVYGSLEYKNDSIGKSILRTLGVSAQLEDAFYIAVFDVDKIDRVGMDATADGVMKTVYLKEVVDDFKATVSYNGAEIVHRYGCSGIDGTTFAPIPGSGSDNKYLMVAYGVYGDNSRDDNDHQVILCYDIADWDSYAQPLVQTAMHKSGPAAPMKKFFVYTGNTNYGVQNLEYDAYTDTILMAVYRGGKEQYPSYKFFAVDGSKTPVKQPLKGLTEEGEVLQLAPMGLYHEASNTCGWYFPYGTTGMYSFGDGTYYFSEDGRNENGWYTNIRLYRWNAEKPFEIVE